MDCPDKVNTDMRDRDASPHAASLSVYIQNDINGVNLMHEDVSKNMAQAVEAQKTLLSSVVKLNELSSRQMEKLLKLQQNWFKDGLDAGISHVKQLSQADDWQDALGRHVAFFQERGQTLAEQWQSTWQMALESGNEWRDTLQGQFEKAGKATTAASKAA